MRDDTAIYIKKLKALTSRKGAAWIDATPTIADIFDRILAARRRDTGFIGGARKDQGILSKFLTLAGLREMEQAGTSVALAAAVKNRVFPKPHPATLQQAGFSPDVAFAIMKLWNRISDRPVEDSAKGREDYVRACIFMRELWTSPNTITAYLSNTGDGSPILAMPPLITFCMAMLGVCCQSQNLAVIAWPWSVKQHSGDKSIWIYYSKGSFYSRGNLVLQETRDLTSLTALGIPFCASLDMLKAMRYEMPTTWRDQNHGFRIFKNANHVNSWEWAQAELAKTAEASGQEVTKLDDIISLKDYDVDALKSRGYSPGATYLMRSVISWLPKTVVRDGEAFARAVSTLLERLDAASHDVHRMCAVIKLAEDHADEEILVEIPKNNFRQISGCAADRAVDYEQSQREKRLKPAEVNEIRSREYWNQYHALKAAERESFGAKREISATKAKAFYTKVTDFPKNGFAPIVAAIEFNKHASTMEKALNMQEWSELERKRGDERRVERPTAIAAGVRGHRTRPPVPLPFTAARIKSDFGIRDVEYGLWVKDNEADSAEAAAIGAMTDLAHVLDVPHHAIGFAGRLAFAVGARGRAYAAHYEPVAKVINMTKTSGAGALAHEWGHALDHWLFDASQRGGAALSFMSETKTSEAAVGTPAQQKAIASAMVNLMNIIRYDFLIPPDKIKIGHQVQRSDVNAMLEKAKAQNDTQRISFLQRAIRQMNLGYSTPTYTQEWIRCNQIPTEMYTASLGRDAKKEKPYWSSPVELFARCFEAWVEAKLHPDVSTYLVTDTNSATSPPEYYPRGEVRERIFAAMAQLMNSVRPVLQAIPRVNPRRRPT